MNDPLESLLNRAEQALSDAVYNFEGERLEVSLKGLELARAFLTATKDYFNRQI